MIGWPWKVLLATTLLWSGEKTVRSDEEWRSLLGRERYCVMRKKATELSFSGEHLHNETYGIYHCAACGLSLFSSSEKYDAGNGWPSFLEPIVQKHVWIKEDRSLPFKRYEVLCRGCGSHLGHVFRNGDDRSLRYTVNSIALDFHKEY
jgi:peptide-methionine (R)-S-oxide reductase